MEDTALTLGHIETEVPVRHPVEKCLFDWWIYGFGTQMFELEQGLESYISDSGSGSHVHGCGCSGRVRRLRQNDHYH